MRRHLNHTCSLPCGSSQAKRTEIFDEVNDVELAIQKDYINGKTHPKGVNAIAWA